MALRAPQTPLTPATPPPTLYFGYGSNLWLHQMAQRCPTSSYLGIARLDNYTWQINTRGYANVVPSTESSTTTTTTTSEPHNYTNEVYGLVYSLLPTDEQRLDVNEGVPVAYTKAHLPCDFWPGSADEKLNVSSSGTPAPERREMLVYIDHKRTSPGTPREEYVYRMNEGIRDALALGVPEGYVNGVMRAYIPEGDEEREGEAGKGGIGEFARAQARGFRDESGVF